MPNHAHQVMFFLLASCIVFQCGPDLRAFELAYQISNTTNFFTSDDSSPILGVNRKPINEGGSPLAGGGWTHFWRGLTGHTTKANIDAKKNIVAGIFGSWVPKNTAFWFFCANIDITEKL